MAKTVVNGRPLRLNAGMLIGVGGEAEIFKINAATVLKRYKEPTHADFLGDALAQEGAKQRIAEQQRKLPAFPRNLPPEVVAPIDLAYDTQGGTIVGYTMPFAQGMEELMKLSVRAYRDTSGIDNNKVVEVFRELHRVVNLIHRSGVVIGDFNDLNIMTDGTVVRLIDADSMQFGTFMCHTYTNRFIDPLLCPPHVLTLARPHNEQSDWYAYFVMLLQSLLYVGPYGGVHRPAQGKRLTYDGRVLGRVTFLNADVIYPKPAIPYGMLPDELLGYLEKVFSKDVREPFPAKLLDALRFTKCTSCGTWHARSVCPQCSTPGNIRQVVTVRGQVTARRLFTTRGKILQAVNQHGILRYLYEENGVLYREGGRRLMSAELSPELKFRIQGDATLVGHGTTLLTVDYDGSADKKTVGTYRGRLPVFDTNEDHVFWESAGQLLQDGRLGPQYIGDVLTDQTLFWVGKQVGFGFYQAGELERAFMFAPGKAGLNDQIQLPKLGGQLIDATCYFGSDKVWFMTASQHKGRLTHWAFVFDASGQLVATDTAEQGSDLWLGRGIRGHLAVGASLFVATDDGIVRLTTDGTSIVKEREFPDTEPFIDANTYLVVGPGGIYAVSTREIVLIEIK